MIAQIFTGLANRRCVLAVIPPLLTLALGACQHVSPTIAHTHIGHAITGFEGAPGDKGLLVVAEERTNTALKLMDDAIAEGIDTRRTRDLVREVMGVTSSDEYGVKEAVANVGSHVQFAAGSEDASDNLRNSVEPFTRGTDAIQARCDLITLLGNDVAQLEGSENLLNLARHIRELAYDNVHGADSNGDGIRGDNPSEFGVKQLRSEMEMVLANEDPAYVTVDRWYLFHLVRLPDCDNCWAWRKWANSSNRGY